MASNAGPSANSAQNEKLEFSEPLKLTRTKTAPPPAQELSEKETVKREAASKKEKSLDIVSEAREDKAGDLTHSDIALQTMMVKIRQSTLSCHGHKSPWMQEDSANKAWQF